MKGNLCRCTGYRSIHDAISGVRNTTATGLAGDSVAPPAARRVVTGTEPYTLDVRTSGLLHLKVLGSPHAHARIVSIDTERALALEGVARGAHPPRLPRDALLHGAARAPRRRPGRHPRARPRAALPRPAGRRGGRRDGRPPSARSRSSTSSTRCCPPSSTRSSPGRRAHPAIHGDKGGESRIHDPARNTVAEFHGHLGDVDAAIRDAAATVTGTWQTQRVAHAALETHATRGWLDEDGRLVLRTSSQVPFLVRDEIARTSRSTPRGCGCSRRAWAAASAASRSCSPRTSSRSRC